MKINHPMPYRCGISAASFWLRAGLWLFFFGLLAPAAYAERRVALIIGNANYTALGAKLSNPLNDATDMSEKLQTLGFKSQDILLRKDLRVEQIDSTLEEFRNLISTAASHDSDVVALVYYSGHGMQLNEKNYLPAVNASITNEFAVRRQSIVLGDILDILRAGKTRVNLVFLDSCRDNPFSIGLKSTTRGLTKEVPPSGTWIAYATQYGQTSDDNPTGRNGIFTGQLLQHIGTPNIPIEQMFKLVASGVVRATSNGQKKQEPWPEGFLYGNFYFSLTAQSLTPTVPIMSDQQDHSAQTSQFAKDGENDQTAETISKTVTDFTRKIISQTKPNASNSNIVASATLSGEGSIAVINNDRFEIKNGKLFLNNNIITGFEASSSRSFFIAALKNGDISVASDNKTIVLSNKANIK